jgi:putative transposase
LRWGATRDIAFIDEHHEEFGVVPTCCALAVHDVQIAPRT